MKAFFQEYGLMIVAILLASMILTFWSRLINDKREDSLAFIYNSNAAFRDLKDTDLDADKDALDSLGGVKNSVKDAYSPYFKVDASINIDNVFRLTEGEESGIFEKVEDTSNTSSGTHYNLVVEDLDKLKKRLTGDYNGISVMKRSSSGEEKADLSELTIVIVESRPRIGYVTSENGVVKEQYITEDVDALDKFGNRIYDKTNNTFVKSSQVAYDTIVWNMTGEASDSDELDDNTIYKKLFDETDETKRFTINPEIPSKYRVIYRYQDGGLKCEYTKIFLNEVRTESDILFGDDT